MGGFKCLMVLRSEKIENPIPSEFLSGLSKLRYLIYHEKANPL